MKKSRSMRDEIRFLRSRCTDREHCPEISPQVKTLCKVNCPIVKECIDKFGIDLVSNDFDYERSWSN